jgi:hypothetical protein
MTHRSAVGLKTAIVAGPECHAVPAFGEKARSEYHFAVEGNCPRGLIGLSACGKSVASSAMEYPTEADQRPLPSGPKANWIISIRPLSLRKAARDTKPRGSAANALPPIGKLRSEAVNSGSPVGNLGHCLCNHCRRICGNLGCVTFSDLGAKSVQEAR